MYKRTTIELDVTLLEKAMKLTNIKTIKDLVHYSLKEVVRRKYQKELLKFKGNVDWEGDLNEIRSI